MALQPAVKGVNDNKKLKKMNKEKATNYILHHGIVLFLRIELKNATNTRL
jgi:hypothetical protein